VALTRLYQIAICFAMGRCLLYDYQDMSILEGAISDTGAVIVIAPFYLG